MIQAYLLMMVCSLSYQCIVVAVPLREETIEVKKVTAQTIQEVWPFFIYKLKALNLYIWSALSFSLFILIVNIIDPYSVYLSHFFCYTFPGSIGSLGKGRQATFINLLR